MLLPPYVDAWDAVMGYPLDCEDDFVSDGIGNEDIDVVGSDAMRKMKTCELRYVPIELRRSIWVGEGGCVPLDDPLKLFLKKDPDQVFWVTRGGR